MEDLLILPNLLSLGVCSSTVSKLALDVLLCNKDVLEVLLWAVGVAPGVYERFSFGMLGRFLADLVKERVRPWRPSMRLVGVLGRSWCMDFGRRDWKSCSGSG